MVNMNNNAEMRPSRVFLTGYYGQFNTGDDALAATIAWGLYQYLKPSCITINSSKRLVMPQGLPVHFLPRRRFKGHLALISSLRLIRSDIWCFGGGSVFHDTLGDSLLRSIRNRVQKFKRLGKKRRVIALGVSLGPIKRAVSYKLLASVLKQLDYIAVRDCASFELASMLGASEQCVLGFDPAVLLPYINLPPVSIPEKTNNALIIAIAPCEYHRVIGDRLVHLDTKRNRALATALTVLAQRTDARFKIFEFNGHETIGDKHVAKELARSVPSDRAFIISYSPNPLFAFEHIRKSTCVIATRLHAAIFAFAARVPFIVLCYHPKVREFARYIGLAAPFILDDDTVEPEQILTAVNSILDNPESSLPQMTLETAQRKALEMFIKLKEAHL